MKQEGAIIFILQMGKLKSFEAWGVWSPRQKPRPLVYTHSYLSLFDTGLSLVQTGSSMKPAAGWDVTELI